MPGRRRAGGEEDPPAAQQDADRDPDRHRDRHRDEHDLEVLDRGLLDVVACGGRSSPSSMLWATTRRRRRRRGVKTAEISSRLSRPDAAPCAVHHHAVRRVGLEQRRQGVAEGGHLVEHRLDASAAVRRARSRRRRARSSGQPVERAPGHRPTTSTWSPIGLQLARARCAPARRRRARRPRTSGAASRSISSRRVRRQALERPVGAHEVGHEVVDRVGEQLGRGARTARAVPSRITATRSAILTASSMSWLTKTTVFGTARCRRRKSFWRRSRVIGSTAEKGSSMSITGGSPARARARPTRCCCPPESWAG